MCPHILAVFENEKATTTFSSISVAQRNKSICDKLLILGLGDERNVQDRLRCQSHDRGASDVMNIDSRL